MPQSEFWLYKNNPQSKEHIKIENELQKQLGDMEGEVQEIQKELEAIKKSKAIIFSSQPRDPTPAIALLRDELAKAKRAADDDKFQREQYENKLQDLELKLNQMCLIKNSLDPDSEIGSLKLKLRDLREENEELKLSLRESEEQLQDYRIKYLQAQQQVEELRNQQGIIDVENKQITEQIQVEIQRMKMQFQEKLQELAPLPDLLKGAQIQLQEAKQLQRLAEESSEELATELKRVKEKLMAAVSSMNEEREEKTKAMEYNKELRTLLNEKEAEIEKFSKENDELKCSTLRLKEKLSQQEVRFDEKVIEYTRLLKDLEELRDECTRSMSRCKDRSEYMRRYLQTQVSELERQLIQSRAQCRAYLKERDDVRQRIQMQLNTLQENFEIVEIRYRTLQNEVASMKNSYSQFIPDDDNEEADLINIEPLMAQ